MSRVAVFCGSAPGNKAIFETSTLELADALVSGGHELVYGGAQVGLMGTLANRMLAQGATVTGVIPEKLFRDEVVHDGLSQLYEVPDMMERKRLMMELSDAFVIIPGGYGTADELFEALTWRQLGVHDKPCGLLNIDAYFDHLLAWLDRCQADELLRPEARRLLVHSDKVSDLLTMLLTAPDTQGAGR